ncbi:MAG: aminoacyl-tRNA deacylase [Acidobacteriota bacterium]
MSTTAAQRFLQQKGVAFEAREYDHKVKGAEFAAEALGWPLAAMAKTLVVGLGDAKRFCLCVLPGSIELSTRTLARAAGAKTAHLASEEEAERLTGYRVGGISPFGTRRAMPVWIDASLMGFPKIGVNGGRRGLIVFLAPQDLQRALGARVADLAA